VFYRKGTNFTSRGETFGFTPLLHGGARKSEFADMLCTVMLGKKGLSQIISIWDHARSK
jgi:hypothetical protein